MLYGNAWYMDGSLRDICVLNASVADWQRVVDWLRAGTYATLFKLNDEPGALPDDVTDVFSRRNEIGVSLRVDVVGLDLMCHFFWHKEIEFDLDPGQVESEQQEKGVIQFMETLGRLVGKEVILTPENRHETPFLSYIPQLDKVVHDPDASIEPMEERQFSRAEAMRLLAKAYGVDENDEAAIMEKMLAASDKPAYPND